jgi:hypothetical protein
MKKIIILTNLIITIILAACSPDKISSISENDIYELPLNDPYMTLLPAEYEIPADMPTTIEDPHLLAAWVFLYNQTEPITIHDGRTIIGRDLALRVIELGILVRWGSEEECGGNSCARRFACHDMDCIENYQPEKIYPIYLSQRYQDTKNVTLARLAGSLAHELYHHTLPFGPVSTNLYEEYWAYYIGAQVEKARWAIFDRYNPNSTACLMAWFRVHGQTGYFGSDVYPMTLDTPVDTTSEVCR